MYASKSIIAFIATITAIISICQGVSTDSPESRSTNAAEFLTDIFSHHWGYRRQIDLNGTWEFRRDPDDIGDNQGWYEGKEKFTDTMTIPGAPQAQGFGEPAGRQKSSFWEEPFWVRRTFTVHNINEDNRVWLRIGGIMPAGEIYINGRYIGYTKSSRTQQRVDVTDFIRPEKENLLGIKVCQSPKVRLDGVYSWEEGAILWTGVYRPVSLEITHRLSVIDLYTQPDLSNGTVGVSITLSDISSEDITVVLDVKDNQHNIGKTEVDVPKGAKQIESRVKLEHFTAWSPKHPQLYTLDVRLVKNSKIENLDKAGIRFGMREISTKGTKFYLNGNPVFIRAFGDDQFYPDTLAPPADKAYHLAHLKRAREYGMNCTKSCGESFTPDFIEAADEAGIMIIQEMPFGQGGAMRANRYNISDEFMDHYRYELDGLVKQSRNHASVLFYSMATEMDFGAQTQRSFDYFSKELPHQTKALAPHALVVDCTGQACKESYKEKGNRFLDFYVTGWPRWIKGVLDETAIETDHKHPLILHEYGYWSCYPDPADKEKYSTCQIKPDWLDRLVQTAWQNGQAELIPLYRKNSLQLQKICIKDGLEYPRRNPDIEGWIFWLMIDFHRYCEGLLDDFWNLKLMFADEFLQWNGDTIIVLAKDGNRCLRMDSTESIPLAVSHYGEQKYLDSVLRWEAVKNGKVFREGQLDIPVLTQGELTQASCIKLNLPKTKKAYQFVLNVTLTHHGRCINTNNWFFWAFPEVREGLRAVTDPENAGSLVDNHVFLHLKSAQTKAIPANASVVVADHVDPALADYLEVGGKCLLFLRVVNIENQVCYYNDTTFYKFFRMIPWNAGTSGNSGTLISYHPAMESFPNDGMCDMQFITMIRGVLPMDFSLLRKYGVVPIIRSIDHYLSNRNNAYMLEFKVGQGKVMATTLGVLERFIDTEEKGNYWRFDSDTFYPNTTPEAQYLFQCLIDYATGDRFDPVASIPKSEFLTQFGSREKMVRPPRKTSK